MSDKKKPPSERLAEALTPPDGAAGVRLETPQPAAPPSSPNVFKDILAVFFTILLALVFLFGILFMVRWNILMIQDTLRLLRL